MTISANCREAIQKTHIKAARERPKKRKGDVNMPKIDTTTISGFDTMTDAEKVAALLDIEVPEKVDTSTLIAKTHYDKVASELADTKRKLKDMMSEEEAAKSDAENAHKEIQEKYDELLKVHTIEKYKAKYIEQGYEAKLAEETAKALFEGNTDKVFANSEKFRASIEQKAKAEALKRTPKPDGAGGSEGEEKTADILMAERIGKAKADSMKSANDILNKYTNMGG